MKALMNERMIELTSEPRGNLITILNYDIYQSPENYERTSERTMSEPVNEPIANQLRSAINKNVKNEKECKECNKKTFTHDELKTDLISKINESGLDQYQDSLLSFFEYRMRKVKKDRYQTPTGLAGLIRKAHGCIEAGYNLNQCIQYAIETERWLDINPEYFRNVFRKKMGTDQSNQAAIEQIMNRINNS